LLVGLFWTGIRLHCTASIAAAVGDRRRLSLCARQITRASGLPSPLNLSKWDRECAKTSVVFLDVWSKLFNEL
jgi:hypothetical protein